MKDPFLTINNKEIPKFADSLMEREPVLPKAL